MTILDIEYPDHSLEDKVFTVDSVKQLIQSIERILSTNASAGRICIFKTDALNILDLKYKHGFDIFNNSVRENNHNNMTWDIDFKGYSRWVYFKNDIPVFFDDACSGTDTPPHTSSFKSSIYDSLEFDSFKKIKF